VEWSWEGRTLFIVPLSVITKFSFTSCTLPSNMTNNKSKTLFLKMVSITGVVIVIMSSTLMALMIVVPSSIISAIPTATRIAAIKSPNAQNSTPSLTCLLLVKLIHSNTILLMLVNF
jgi:hypothetical protein